MIAHFSIWKTPVGNVFSGMKQRCYNKKQPKYNNYGGRGITVCDQWLKNPELFYKWSLENGYKKGLTLDRIDVNGNYCPENCRWTTMKTQERNRTNNRRILFKGLYMCTTEWDEHLGFPNGTVRDRLDRGYTEEEALSTPFNKIRKKFSRKGKGRFPKYITYKNETLSYADWERKLGMNKNTISRRLYKGFTEIEALSVPYRRYNKS